MYLKALEIQGFKSFADKTVLQFGNDITAIVGPNGSGKSNISDAISWVMGEMSSKALRGAKMEDVIFGGTQKRGPLGFAEASLILDNSDGALPVETPEVTVTRRYYRSGESEYYINRQTARLRDINEMFMDTGLGKEGYSNIGQGRIDEILALKSTDRREVFEEAAGISKFRHRKEETERRLASTEDNLMRIGDKISELELQVEPLRQQAEKAKKYLELREELKGQEIALWLENLQNLAGALKKAETDYASAAFILEQQHAELTRLYQLSEQLSLQLNQKGLLLEQKRETISGLEGELHRNESEAAVLQAGVENARQNILRVRQELADQLNRSGGISARIREQEEKISQIGDNLRQAQQNLELALEESRKLSLVADEKEREVLQLRAQEALLQTEAADRRADMASLSASMEEILERKDTVLTDLNAAKTRKNELEAQVLSFEKALEEAKETVSGCKNMAAGYALRQKSRLERRDSLQKTVDSLRIELQTAQSRSKMLRETLETFEGAPKAVRLVMQESRRNTLGKVYGPVSALIRTDDDYAVAIETALGGAMQNVAVATREDGKRVLEFLKRCSGGRVTCEPLDAKQGRTLQEKGLEACAGFVGLASELVSYDPKFRGLMEYLLGRTVVVDHLNHAVAMARQYQSRFKIVTLDGQVMNTGGSMTGGSVSHTSGVLSRANELERLAETEKKLDAELKKQEAQLAEAARAAAQVEYELTTVQGQLRQAEDDVLRAEGQTRQAQALVEAIEQNIAAYERELQAIENRSGGDEGRLKLLQEETAKAERRIAELQNKLDTLTDGQNELSQQAAALQDRITGLRLDAAAQEAERTAAAETVRQLQALAEAMEGDRGQRENLIAGYEAEIAELQEKLTQSAAQHEQLEQTVAAAQQDLQSCLQDRADTEARRTKAEKQAQEKNKEILDMERESARLEQKKNAAQMEEKQILDKLWESYELTPSTAAPFAAEIESITAAGRRITELKRKISGLGTPNLGAIEEFDRVNERYEYLSGQRDDVLHAKKELENIVRTITTEMTEIFVREFAKINEYFGKTFEEMFGGGKGELILENPAEPLSCGIEIKVQPPGKQLKTITLLSGGEKAFVAIALYFAILKVRPTPFCLLDEIDAALDDRNVERFATYLRTLCRKTQFIVITHRRGTMEESDVLYGVTMQEQGVSRILHLDLNQLTAELGITE